MKYTRFITAIFATMLLSCGIESNGHKQSELRKDSLETAKKQLEEEINGYFSAIDEIEKNLDKVKELEGFISVQTIGENLNMDTRAVINQKIKLLSSILEKNNADIDSLKNRLLKSDLKISQLENTMGRLSLKISEQLKHIENLQLELVKKDELITQRNITIQGLANHIESLEDENTQNKQRIEQQEQILHTAWYVFGTYRELKKQKIITSDGLFSAPRVLEKSFNKDYFIKIDIRETKEIPLYARKAKIRTNHPKTSYTLGKTNDLYVLKILNPTEFWEVSNYLVIEVD